MSNYESIIKFFEENDDALIECIEELDSWNGFLGDDRYYYMEVLDELFHGESTIDLLNRAYFGYDADVWMTDGHGEKTYGAFNPNRDYFYFNGYGNLVSSDYRDYSDHNDKWFIEDLIENRDRIGSINNYSELIELLDNAI